MLRSRDISVGKYYVNNARKIAREVIETDDKTVTFNTYHLDTGNSCSTPSQCTRRDFTHWADREATPTELAGLKDRLMEALLYSPRMPTPEKPPEISVDQAVNPLAGTSLSLHRLI
jgi:hypothetical protein